MTGADDKFAHKMGIKNFEVGRMGAEHALLPELGPMTAGMSSGADLHTCTYGALGVFPPAQEAPMGCGHGHR